MKNKDTLSKTFRSLSILTLSLSLLAGGSIAHADTQKNPYGAAPSIDPASPNDPILVLQNGSKTVKYSYNALLKLKTYPLSIFEPFVKKRQSFTCVAVKELFSAVGIKGTQKVSTIALNDYSFKAVASGFTSSQGCLAVKRNGSAIPYDQGGPIRLIYPDKASWAKNLDAWNWSLATIKTISK